MDDVLCNCDSLGYYFELGCNAREFNTRYGWQGKGETFSSINKGCYQYLSQDRSTHHSGATFSGHVNASHFVSY